MKAVTRLVHKLRRSFASITTDEAADLLEAQDEEIRLLRQKVAELSRQGGREAAAEIERLRAALEPFADVIKGNWSQQPDDLPLDVGFGATDLRLKLRLGDFRTARAALEGK